MNNLHRELAPISAAAWAGIEAEASRSFKRNVAGRRLVDVTGPFGDDKAAVTTGHRTKIDSPVDGIEATLRGVQQLVELKVPFTVTREAIDDVDRGAQDSNWDPVIDAAQELALAEDRAIFAGYEAAGITGIANAGAPTIPLPDNVLDYPDALSRALAQLRLASIDGPYSLALSADVYSQVSETSNHGYPIREHLRRLIEGDLVWAPALTGAIAISTRGGDFELAIGEDVSIGYDSHDGDVVNLYFRESFTFLTYTGNAAIQLTK
ncbi:bacteriocin family protein [Gordonia sp. TBRC 11910]|uniref:Type 1 encapsulin shell protein n=1 Tax=Gordonia asplenii TaxID=2725283 RepID=A0A848KXT6_9ACTN|nr:family 1 encapsulin nanocompartment shell protein [Gordonia asplenii]NMO01665.1 bacteriocin family protein [Gordonia asplenii]